MDGRVATPVWDAAPVRRGLEDRMGRSAWSWPSLEERRSFVVRVAELACGRVRVRAGGFLDLEELEEVDVSSLEALGASWRKPDPSSGVAELERVELGEHGAGAMSRVTGRDGGMICWRSASYAIA